MHRGSCLFYASIPETVQKLFKITTITTTMYMLQKDTQSV